MEHLHTLGEWRAFARDQRAAGRTVGLVPTMGALHAGHVALVRRARDAGDVVMLTSFVNPRQFNDPTDLSRYPSTPAADVALAREAGVDALITPALSEMWPDFPEATDTTVHVARLSQHFEGADRPGHFDGVASVVAKLFNLTGECRAYFGEKDFQQLAVVRRLVRDLGFAVEVVGVPTVRDETGLALSSRNARLSDDGRHRALAFSRALREARITSRPASQLGALATAILTASGVDVAYATVVDPATLVPLTDSASGPGRLLLAGWVEGVRLIDNDDVTVTGDDHVVSH